MKGLRAFGPSGSKYGADWNWCGQHEVVVLDGFVCCNAEACGCNRSFGGQKSRMSTSLAIVSELADSERTKATDMLEPLLKDLNRCTVVRAKCEGEEWVLQPITELAVGTEGLLSRSGAWTHIGDVFVVFQQEPIDSEEPYVKALAMSEYEWLARDCAIDTIEALLKEYRGLTPTAEDCSSLAIEKGDNAGNRHPSCEEWMVIKTTDSTVYAYVWVQKLSWSLRPLDLSLAT